MTDAGDGMNPLHLGIDPADTWIRIRINPDARNRDSNPRLLPVEVRRVGRDI